VGCAVSGFGEPFELVVRRTKLFSVVEAVCRPELPSTYSTSAYQDVFWDLESFTNGGTSCDH
jgi:hypothetical protein